MMKIMKIFNKFVENEYYRYYLAIERLKTHMSYDRVVKEDIFYPSHMHKVIWDGKTDNYSKEVDWYETEEIGEEDWEDNEEGL